MNDARVLVVDDTPMMRTQIVRELRSLGVTRIHEADHGKAALSTLQKQHAAGEPIEMILCDWTMPGMSGIEVLKSVRKNKVFSQLPFLMITAKADASELKEAMLAGIDDCIIKPFDGAKLAMKLRGIWEKPGRTR